MNHLAIQYIWLTILSIIVGILLVMHLTGFTSAWESARPVPYRLKDSLARPWDVVLNEPVM